MPASLATLPQLISLRLQQNAFTFNGLETIAQHHFDTLQYSPQQRLSIHRTGNNLSVYAGGTVSNNTYRWFMDGILRAIIIGDSTFKPTQYGLYNVQVTNALATALRLKSDTIIFNRPNNSQPLMASADLAQSTCCSLFPNPASTATTIVFNTKGKYIITVFDIDGRRKQEMKVIAAKQSPYQLNLNDYAAGIYIITVADDQHNTKTFSLIKQ